MSGRRGKVATSKTTNKLTKSTNKISRKAATPPQSLVVAVSNITTQTSGVERATPTATSRQYLAETNVDLYAAIQALKQEMQKNTQMLTAALNTMNFLPKQLEQALRKMEQHRLDPRSSTWWQQYTWSALDGLWEENKNASHIEIRSIVAAALKSSMLLVSSVEVDTKFIWRHIRSDVLKTYRNKRAAAVKKIKQALNTKFRHLPSSERAQLIDTIPESDHTKLVKLITSEPYDDAEHEQWFVNCVIEAWATNTKLNWEKLRQQKTIETFDVDNLLNVATTGNLEDENDVNDDEDDEDEEDTSESELEDEDDDEVSEKEQTSKVQPKKRKIQKQSEEIEDVPEVSLDKKRQKVAASTRGKR